MSDTREILIFENSYKLANYLFNVWIKIAKEAILKNDIFCVALSGGRTPIEFYSKLSSFVDYDIWMKTHIFLTDERFVPLQSQESNFRMIKENLLDYINIPQENIHFVDTEKKDVFASAEDYEKNIKDFFNKGKEVTPQFDLILLGLGTDGHTASLFPNDPHSHDQERIALGINHPEVKFERITLSLAVLNNAKRIVFLVLGKDKAEIVKKVVQEKGDYPAAKVNPKAGGLSYLLDKDSARLLPILENYSHLPEAISVKL